MAIEKNIQITAPDNIPLYGILTIPEHIEKPPVAIIVPGFGNIDENGNNTKSEINTYKSIAQSLSKYNIASLRYAKRYAEKYYSNLKNKPKASIDININDLLLWIKTVRQLKTFSQIILIGHSEGSLVASIAAQKTQVDKLISIAGCGRPFDQVLAGQMFIHSKFLHKEYLKILEKLKKGQIVQDVPIGLRKFISPDKQTYFLSCLKYQPTQEIAKLNIPILIIQGTADLHMSIIDAKLLASANPNAKLVIIENMNHIMTEVQSKDVIVNLSYYLKKNVKIVGRLIDEIANFINN